MTSIFAVSGWDADPSTESLNKSLFGGQSGNKSLNKKKLKHTPEKHSKNISQNKQALLGKRNHDSSSDNLGLKSESKKKKHKINQEDSSEIRVKARGEKENTERQKKNKGNKTLPKSGVPKESKEKDAAKISEKGGVKVESEGETSPKKKRQKKKKKCKNKYAHLAGKTKLLSDSLSEAEKVVLEKQLIREKKKSAENSEKTEVQTKKKVKNKKRNVPDGKTEVPQNAPDKNLIKESKKRQKKKKPKSETTKEPESNSVPHTNATLKSTKSSAKSKLPFNVDRLKTILKQASGDLKTETLKDAKPTKKKKERGPKDFKDEEEDESPIISSPTKKDTAPKSLRDKMKERLNAARFRYLNEQLYTIQGDEAFQMFSEDPHAFDVYHDGFQSQVNKWPQNPVQLMIEYVKSRPANEVVADFGCGEANLAQSVPNKVHSFDLVAVNKHVTACDMADVPLPSGSVHIGVFCLALMGTNLTDFLAEANRVLKNGGKLLVAEVVSRFEKVGSFVRKMEKMGFSLQNKDDGNKMFIWFEFRKTGESPPENIRPKIELEPCIYKRR